MGFIEFAVKRWQITLVAFALLFVILLIRPQGLLGRVQIQKV